MEVHSIWKYLFKSHYRHDGGYLSFVGRPGSCRCSCCY